MFLKKVFEMTDDNTIYHKDTQEPLFTVHTHKPEVLGHVDDELSGKWTPGDSNHNQLETHIKPVQLKWHGYQTEMHPHLKDQAFHTSYGAAHEYGHHLYDTLARKGFAASQHELEPAVDKENAEGKLEDNIHDHRSHLYSRDIEPVQGVHFITPHYSYHHTFGHWEGDDGENDLDDENSHREVSSIIHHGGHQYHSVSD